MNTPNNREPECVDEPPEDPFLALVQRLAETQQEDIDALPAEERTRLREEVLRTFGGVCCLAGCPDVSQAAPVWLDIKRRNQYGRWIRRPQVRVGCSKLHGLSGAMAHSIIRCV